MSESYIKAYTDFFSPEYCNSIIERYEYVWNLEAERVKELSLCSGCTQCSCNRIDIMQHDVFMQDRMNIAAAFDNMVMQYKEDCKIEPFQFPEQYGFEDIKIKKYTANTEQQFKNHVDVADYASARRFLIFMVYLNDDFEGGETVFNQLNITVKPQKGMLLMFPPFWTYLHHARKVTGNNSKYFLGSYCHYL